MNSLIVGAVSGAASTRATVAVDANGRLLVSPAPANTLATYAVTSAALSPPAAATDVFTLNGSATTTVRILQVTVSGTATATTAIDLSLIKRPALDTGGTSSAPTIHLFDSNNAAATATATQYSVNPATLGGGTPAVLDTRRFTVTTVATPAIPIIQLVWNFGLSGQAVVLRGAAQQLALNLGGATIAGLLLTVCVIWTEE